MSDSLEQAGVAQLYSAPAQASQLKVDVKWIARTPADSWFASEPAFKEYVMLSISAPVEEGQTRYFDYVISFLPGENGALDQGVLSQHMQNASDSFGMTYGAATYTRLLW